MSKRAPNAAGDLVAARQPAVDAVEQRHRDAGADRGGRDRRHARLADQRRDQRDQHRAQRGDLVGRAEPRERMMLLQEADRQSDDRRKQRRGLQRVGDRRAAAPRAPRRRARRRRRGRRASRSARSRAAAHRAAATAVRWFMSSGFEFEFRVRVLYQRDCNAGARVLGGRSGPRRDPRRDAARRRRGRGRRPRAVQRHQPRHRGAGVSGPRAGERARTHARAVSGGRVSGAGEVRLRQRRRRRAAARRLCRAATCSRCIRIRRAMSCRRATSP